jgi:hypothetical protein
MLAIREQQYRTVPTREIVRRDDRHEIAHIWGTARPPIERTRLGL